MPEFKTFTREELEILRDLYIPDKVDRYAYDRLNSNLVADDAKPGRRVKFTDPELVALADLIYDELKELIDVESGGADEELDLKLRQIALKVNSIRELKKTHGESRETRRAVNFQRKLLNHA